MSVNDTLLTVIADPVAEEGTPVLEVFIVDDEDEPFQPDTLTRTLYDLYSGAVISGPTDVLADCTDGHVLSPVDSVDTTLPSPGSVRNRTIRALFEWTWPTDRKWHHEIEFVVKANAIIT